MGSISSVFPVGRRANDARRMEMRGWKRGLFGGGWRAEEDGEKDGHRMLSLGQVSVNVTVKVVGVPAHGVCNMEQATLSKSIGLVWLVNTDSKMVNSHCQASHQRSH